MAVQERKLDLLNKYPELVKSLVQIESGIRDDELLILNINNGSKDTEMSAESKRNLKAALKRLRERKELVSCLEELIAIKEETRITKKVMNQIKYENSTITNKIIRGHTQKIKKERAIEMKKLLKELEDANARINQAEIDYTQEVYNRDILVSEYYGLRFEESIRKYLVYRQVTASKLNIDITNNPKFEEALKKQIKNSTNIISKTSSRSGFIEAAFQREFLKIAAGIDKFEHAMDKQHKLPADSWAITKRTLTAREHGGVNKGYLMTTLEGVRKEVEGKIPVGGNR